MEQLWWDKGRNTPWGWHCEPLWFCALSVALSFHFAGAGGQSAGSSPSGRPNCRSRVHGTLDRGEGSVMSGG